MTWKQCPAPSELLFIKLQQGASNCSSWLCWKKTPDASQLLQWDLCCDKVVLLKSNKSSTSVVLVSHGQGNCFLLFLLQTVAWLCLFLVIFPMAFPWPRSQAADRWTTQLYEQDAVSRRQRDVHLTAAILLWKNPSHKLLMQSRKHCVISCVTPSLCVWAATTTTTTMTSYFITLSSPFSLH